MSPKLFLPILILIPLAAMVLIFKSGLSQNTPQKTATNNSISPTPDSLPLTSDVIVAVSFLPSQSDPQTLAFEVVLNTHSIDLDDIDFQKSVILEASGQKFSPVEVKTEGAGHHRSAVVKFSRRPSPVKIIFQETSEINTQEFTFDNL